MNWKHQEGNGHRLIEILSHVLEGQRKKWCNWWLVQDLNQESPEYTSIAIERLKSKGWYTQ